MNITYDTVPTVFYNGMSNTVKIRVNDWYGNGVGNATVSFNSTNTTTNSNGIATFNPTNMIDGQTYTATCNGCSVSQVMNAITVTDVEVKIIQDGICALNYSEPLTVTLSGEGYTGAIPVTITDGTNTKTVDIVPNTDYPYEYQGMGNGDVTITASCGTASDSATIEDLLSGYKGIDYDYNLTIGKDAISRAFKESDGILIVFASKVTGANQSVTFYTTEIPNSMEFVVKGVQKADKIKFGLLNGGNYIFNGLTALDKVKIVREDTVLKYYKNDELVHTNQVGDAVLNMWEIKVLNFPITEKLETRIRIDELKIK